MCKSMQKKENHPYRWFSQKCPLYAFEAVFYLVENIGVEPMTSCMPCKRSSQLS